MIDPKFKVGQKWRTRGGDGIPALEFKIVKINDHKHWPIVLQSDDGSIYENRANGRALLNGADCALDLVELVEDVP